MDLVHADLIPKGSKYKEKMAHYFPYVHKYSDDFIIIFEEISIIQQWYSIFVCLFEARAGLRRF